MAQRYIQTQWGVVAVNALPADLRDQINAARFTKAGLPDKRSRKSVAAFKAVESWIFERWMV